MSSPLPIRVRPRAQLAHVWRGPQFVKVTGIPYGPLTRNSGAYYCGRIAGAAEKTTGPAMAYGAGPAGRGACPGRGEVR